MIHLTVFLFSTLLRLLYDCTACVTEGDTYALYLTISFGYYGYID